MSLDPGTRLGAYEVLSSLGRGGMGEVYRARDSRLGREVALKVLNPELSSDSERLGRFEQEARAASALNHPNIVHIYDVGATDEIHFIAMELVEGTTLRQLLAEGPLPEPRLLDLARQLADGLAKAHGAGIVHRDLKPENVMVTTDGFLKILDFGLAKLTTLPLDMGSNMATLAKTRHGILIGTVEYMSPEQAAGRAADYRSDQFALGLILYEMATGKLAFHRDTAAQTLASIIENEPPPISSAGPRPPAGLEEVVGRCLEKDPAARYQDTRELARELKSLPRSPGKEAVAVPPVPVGGRREEADPPAERRVGAVSGSDVRSSLEQVRLELGRRFLDRLYHVDSGDRIRALSEWRLRKRLRQNRYTGVEMVRREGEEVWVPLHETRIFKEEVPHQGSSMALAERRRVLRFVQHLAVFLTFGAAMFFATGKVPFWMGFWAVGLVAQAVRSLPSMFSIFFPARLGAPQSKALEEGKTAMSAGDPDALLSPSFREEVGRVRELVDRREGEEKKELLEELDRIVERMKDISSKERDLLEQTSPQERERLETAEKEAYRRSEETSSARDRKLYQRQLEVVRRRRETIDKALAVLERLRVRQDVTEHQVKQLRLDLSRAQAASASVPELSSRLQDIRHEVDATDEVDEALARELTS
jgi:serine/threonine protein kinase